MATAQGLRLYIANIGGHPAGHEGQLIAQVRGRFNLKYERNESLKHLTGAFIYSVDPIVDYLRSSLGDLKCRGLPRMDFAIHVYELYRIAVSRTRIGRRYIDVTVNAEAWANVEASLQLRLAGTPPTRPALKSAPTDDAPNWEPSLATRPPWWAERRWFSCFIALASVAVFYLRELLPAGRYRFYIPIASIALLVGAVIFWRHGPEVIPGILLSFADTETDGADDVEESESQAESAASSPAKSSEAADPAASANFVSSPSAPPPEDAVAMLSEEVRTLKDLMSAMVSGSSAPPGLPAPNGRPAGQDSGPARADLGAARDSSGQTTPPPGFAPSSTRRSHPRSESFVDGTDGAPGPSCADAGRLPADSARFHWLGAISGCGKDFSSSGRPRGAPPALDSAARYQPLLGSALLARSCTHGAGCWLRAGLAAYPPRSGLQWPQHHRASSRQPQE